MKKTERHIWSKAQKEYVKKVGNLISIEELFLDLVRITKNKSLKLSQVRRLKDKLCRNNDD